MGFYRSSCVFMDFSVSICVLIGPFAFLWVLVSSYGYFCVVMDSSCLYGRYGSF